MKAQMVKNALIVPVGAKGGFVLKNPPTEGGREALTKRGDRLLQDVPVGHARRDRQHRRGRGRAARAMSSATTSDDPYLVVAADKGTATFSDIANEVSKDYGFWLGDAFASGGSQGYDHKAMGITARGAWESVKRHFRELRRRHPDHRLHHGGDRRHVRRRVRQRDAALQAHQADRRLQPRARVHRSRPGPGTELRRAKAPVRHDPLGLERLRRVADLRGRRGVRAQREVDQALRPGPRGAEHRGRQARPQRADPGHPQSPGRSALQRRNRHLRQGLDRVARRRGRQGQRPAAGQRHETCAAGWSARAGTSASRRRGGSSTR